MTRKMDPSRANLRSEIETILKDANLETVSRKTVRNQLESLFSCDLSADKKYINETILEVIENQQRNEKCEADDECDEATVPNETSGKKLSQKNVKQTRKIVKERKSPFDAELSLSPELAAVMGTDRMSRPQIVKELWNYIRANNLQDPNDKRRIVFDAQLKSVFQREAATMFTLNKYIKRHVRKPEDLPVEGWKAILRDGISSEEDETPKKEPSKKKKKRLKKTTGDKASEDEKIPKRNSAFNAELAVSPELAQVLGSDRLARPTIVKLLWKYIHEHQLQDPTDKRKILLDDNLRNVFKRDSFTMFSMNKFVKRHVCKPESLPSGGWADIQRDGVSSEDEAVKK
ncbi:hypothetical protein ABG067_003183 [Albugo candida]